jgi:hypothetical protein
VIKEKVERIEILNCVELREPGFKFKQEAKELSILLKKSEEGKLEEDQEEDEEEYKKFKEKIKIQQDKLHSLQMNVIPTRFEDEIPKFPTPMEMQRGVSKKEESELEGGLLFCNKIKDNIKELRTSFMDIVNRVRQEDAELYAKVDQEMAVEHAIEKKSLISEISAKSLHKENPATQTLRSDSRTNLGPKATKIPETPETRSSSTPKPKMKPPQKPSLSNLAEEMKSALDSKHSELQKHALPSQLLPPSLTHPSKKPPILLSSKQPDTSSKPHQPLAHSIKRPLSTGKTHTPNTAHTQENSNISSNISEHKSNQFTTQHNPPSGNGKDKRGPSNCMRDSDGFFKNKSKSKEKDVKSTMRRSFHHQNMDNKERAGGKSGKLINRQQLMQQLIADDKPRDVSLTKKRLLDARNFYKK